MKKLLFAFATLILVGSDKPVPRPPIYGISHVRLRSTNRESSLTFFATTLGFHSPKQCQDTRLSCVAVGGPQFVELAPAPPGFSGNSLEEVGFLTSDVSAMRKLLLSQGMHPGRIETHGYSSDSVTVSGPEGSHTDDRSSCPSFAITDPEGNHIIFVEQHGETVFLDYDPRAGKKLIHAGFVVHDRAAEDKFYKDILGFHVYWHGGMKEGEDNWVDMQVPDGTDWIEYMLNVPADASKHTLGVMNHIALGVADIHAAEKQLRANGWTGTEQPKIGRDGKWQLNLYDPDDTRVEFMEFTPTQKPCCSEYTGRHPGPESPSKAPAKP